jgi:serine/threonine-protein kinase HipA
MNTPIIEVVIWDTTVGAITLDPRYGFYAFGYTDAWKRRGVELAPLTMPLSSNVPAFLFPNLPQDTFHRMPAMLSDALPDTFGNALIDAWMATHGVAKDDVTMLDRLAYMGKRGMGALEFKPARGTRKDAASPLEIKDLVEEARRLIHGDLSIAAQADAALTNMIQVGTSAGGARAKAVVAWNPQTNQIRSGQFDVAEGFEHWLLKFDGVGADPALGTSHDYGRIEYAYHLMALAAGLEMYPCRLLEENGRAHFMTRRFDRELKDGKTVKHHIQTLCGIDQLDFKQLGTHAYAQLFSVVERLDLGDDAIDEVFRRMAFNVMARNCDDHTKNFSFLLRQGGDWTLAPAYDVTHSHSPSSKWTSQHCMSVNGKFQNITRSDLLLEADRFGVRKAKTLLAEVRAAIENWSAYVAAAEISPVVAEAVAKDFELV